MRGEFRGFSGGLGEALGEAVQATDGDAIGDRITVTRASLRPLLLRRGSGRLPAMAGIGL